MHVSLTPKLEELVRRKVESGLYTNASEVVREALVEGERSGPPEPLDMNAILAELDAETPPAG